MATIKEITTLCKAGKLVEAYQLAKADYESSPQNIWSQREVGWVLYYMIKEDVDKVKCSEIYEHLEELTRLDLLSVQTDALIFDNVLWKLAEFLKNTPNEKAEVVDRIFSFISKYSFTSSKGYSYLLKAVIGFATWNRMVEFLEWWKIDNLQPEDYQQFQLENGNKIMSLAEQVYIAYSKALLRLNDKEKIQDFLPKIEKLIDDYPDMTYPGYYCGRLMLTMGAEKEEALAILLPFVRKKKSEFWVWQLLSEVYKDDKDMQLACLLRATRCRTKESFLGKVRIKLVSIYIEKGDYPRAKYHLNQVVRFYEQQTWHLSYEAQVWLREGWVRNTQEDNSEGIDYKRYTDAILLRGANESIAVVTYVDLGKKRAFLVYDKEKRANIPLSDLRIKIKKGTLLKLRWLQANEKGINVVGAEEVSELCLEGLLYIRKINGKVVKRSENPFAFVKNADFSCYIKPEDVKKFDLVGNEKVSALAVLDYNKKKETWTWTCVSLKKY